MPGHSNLSPSTILSLSLSTQTSTELKNKNSYIKKQTPNKVKSKLATVKEKETCDQLWERKWAIKNYTNFVAKRKEVVDK